MAGITPPRMKNSLVEIGIGVVEGVASGMGAPLPEATAILYQPRIKTQPNCNITMFSLAQRQDLGKPLTKSVCAIGIAHSS